MPNLKIYVDEALLPGCRAGLTAAMHPLRDLLCQELNVTVAACQFAILPVIAMPDLPRVNVELHILPHPERTRDRLTRLAEVIQSQIGSVTETRTAVRIATLSPEAYVALK